MTAEAIPGGEQKPIGARLNEISKAIRQIIPRIKNLFIHAVSCPSQDRSSLFGGVASNSRSRRSNAMGEPGGDTPRRSSICRFVILCLSITFSRYASARTISSSFNWHGLYR